MLGVAVGIESIAELVSRLPLLDDVDWSLIDLRRDVSAFETLDEYYLIPVTIHSRHSASSITVSVEDPDDWISSLGGATLRTEGRRFGLRQTSHTQIIPAGGTYSIPLSEPSAETLIEVNGIALDVSAGTYIGAAQTVEPISGGILPDIFALEALASTWQRRDTYHRNIVLDPRNRGADPEVSGLNAMRELLRGVVSRANPVTVDILDPYPIGGRMLGAIGEQLGYGSTIRLVCGTNTHDADFRGVQARTGVTVKRYKPDASAPLHDRFLRVGTRMWSLGASLNHLGFSLSAILEIVDPITFGEIASVLNLSLVGVKEA